MSRLFLRFEIRSGVGQHIAGGTLSLDEPETAEQAYDGALRLANAAELALLNLAGVGYALEPRDPQRQLPLMEPERP